jgi:hypothetical protein
MLLTGKPLEAALNIMDGKEHRAAFLLMVN